MPTTFEVLIIEDDLVLRQQLAQLVSMWGFDVRAAASGEEGLGMLHEALPDIVLTDLMLPGTSGAAVLEHVRTHNSHLPVLVMTAYASLESAITALKQGAYDYLLKPITPAELEAALVRATAAVNLHRAQAREAQLRHVAAVALTLAHEINNPLAMIMGELQLQLETGEPLDANALRVCLEATQRIATTVRKLTDLSEISYERYAGFELIQLDSRMS